MKALAIALMLLAGTARANTLPLETKVVSPSENFEYLSQEIRRKKDCKNGCTVNGGITFTKAGSGITFQDGTTQATAFVGGSGIRRQFVSTVTVNLHNAAHPAIPEDDTIPQINEGYRVLVATITPILADSNLLISVALSVSEGTNNCNNSISMTFFQDDIANAIAATGGLSTASSATADPGSQSFKFIIPAVNTAKRFYAVHIGCEAVNAACLNCREAGGRLFGGVQTSSMFIEEISP